MVSELWPKLCARERLKMSQMNFDKVYNKIVAASYATGVRGDLSIADFQKLPGGDVHVLMAYSEKVGRPTGDDIERYFSKFYEGRIVPIMATCRIKPNSVSVVAKLNTPTRPIEDSQDKGKMTPIIAGMMYLDNQLHDHWEVKDEGGKKILAKNSKENVEQIIAARRNRMFVTETPQVSLSALSSVKDLLAPEAKVAVYLGGGVLVPFTISAAVKGGFKGKLEDGKEVVVAKEQVMDVMQQAEKNAPNEDAKLVDYFAKAYGDKKFATDLVKAKK
jgi:hypothetical protein